MIRILDKNVADKIAAGEVIDRPVSIIKELLENALDAGATSVTVEIRNGGKSYIRVTDNGCGIPADEAELAFMRHATSKITEAEDLDAISTLGFRGEALASICAVARVELITKTSDAKAGRKLTVEGSEVLENTAIGCPDGTTVTVRDLFFNVPARQKFLASDSSETRRIIDMVSRIALSYTDVKFTLINGKTKVFSTRGNGNILNNIISIYGADMSKDLLPVESSRNGFVIKGFVSAPSNSAPSRTKQIFCINGRVVSSKTLENALDGAYKEKLFHGRFPIAFLFLAMPAHKLDVNVHPTKKEVRFDDPFEVEDFVKDALRDALTVKEAVPQVRFTEKKTAEPVKIAETPVKVAETPAKYEAELSVKLPETKVVTREVKTSPKAEKFEQGEQVDIKNILSTKRASEDKKEGKTETPKQELIKNKTPEELTVNKPSYEPFDFSGLSYMGAVFNTYITACDADSFYLIDQHAAHERIFYEKLLRQYNDEDKLRQQLLLPLNFNVSAQVAAAEDSWIEEVRNIGYDIEFFGNNTYIVREIPAFMEMNEAESFLSDMFREFEDKPDLTNRKILDKIITRSCKSAVKGGDSLSAEEIDALMKDLKGCINPFSCPHGRPTFIRMTKYEIEKLFKRV